MDIKGHTLYLGSLPVRGAWIEIPQKINNPSGSKSLPVRGAWIEIAKSPEKNWKRSVAPCEGSVD